LFAKDHELKDGWKNYRSHTQKNRMTAAFDFIMKGATRLEDFRDMFRPDAVHAQLFDNVKQLGVYSDCLGNVHWSEPSNVVDEKLSRFLVTLAEVVARAGFATELEIDLWARHFSDVPKENMTALTAALGDWYEDMQRHGLAPPGENEMKRFVSEGFRPPKPH
jgi:AbiV